VIDGDCVSHADVVEPRSAYWVGSVANDIRVSACSAGANGRGRSAGGLTWREAPGTAGISSALRRSLLSDP
jgi:hypothetical protein